MPVKEGPEAEPPAAAPAWAALPSASCCAVTSTTPISSKVLTACPWVGDWTGSSVMMTTGSVAAGPSGSPSWSQGRLTRTPLSVYSTYRPKKTMNRIPATSRMSSSTMITFSTVLPLLRPRWARYPLVYLLAIPHTVRLIKFPRSAPGCDPIWPLPGLYALFHFYHITASLLFPPQKAQEMLSFC